MNGQQFQMVIHELNKFHNPKILTEGELNDWWMEIKTLDGYMALIAAKHISSTNENGFMPTPARLKAVIEEVSGNKRMSAQEAWAIARPVCSRYTTREALERIPDDVRQCIRIAGGTSYLGEQAEYRAKSAFESAWKGMGDKEEREKVKELPFDPVKLLGD